MKEKVMDAMQRFSKAMFIPVLILPIAGILIAVGNLFTNTRLMEVLPFLNNPVTTGFGTLLSGSLNAIMTNLGVIFCVGLAVGLAHKKKSEAGFIGLLAFLVFINAMNRFMGLTGILVEGNLSGTGQTTVLGVQVLDMGVFLGLMLGIIVAWIHNRFCETEFNNAFQIYGGTRFVFIVLIPLMVVLAVVLTYVWPFAQAGINSLGSFIQASGNLGLFVYGMLERLLIPTGLHHLVLGVSGGLDSTLALLVCHEALKQLDLPSKNLMAITMPGFGTSDRTYYNALSLISALGAQNRDISIKASVLQHFEDIGHDPSLRDVTYENAQARERTQILMDVANSCRGIVVGTGDMSEDALGWCTFGGDHLANYNVNVCLTKTMIRRMVTFLCSRFDDEVGSILRDIVDTPVSPELLPPDESGKIQQKTEDILGSYELHDFFLYYLLRCSFPPRKLYYYACVAFSGQFSASYILEKLKVFLNRFFAGQFKRSCTPDSADITEVCLSRCPIPSDCSPQALLSDLADIR